MTEVKKKPRKQLRPGDVVAINNPKLKVHGQLATTVLYRYGMWKLELSSPELNPWFPAHIYVERKHLDPLKFDLEKEYHID